MVTSAKESQTLFLFAGEHSGDLYGSGLLKALKAHNPHVHAVGVGGPLMREAGLEILLPMEEFQIMGFVDVFKKLPTIIRQFRQVRQAIIESQPAVAIFIDYPGFNLRLERSLRRKGYTGKLVHYVCPTVWAWGYERVKTMVRNLDLLLTIFPFEPPIFKDTQLKAQFVGHPLLEELREHEYKEQWADDIGLTSTDNLLALFPGSRRDEIRRVLARQLQAALKLKAEQTDLKIAISCAGDHVEPLIREIIATIPGLDIGKDIVLVPRAYSYELMRECRSAIAKSGTVNLEIALHHKPCVVVYEISMLNYLILWYIFRLHLNHYSIVNILLGRRLYPELIADPFTPEDIYQALAPLHREGEERNACIAGCHEAHQALMTAENAQPSQEAALAIEKLMKN